MLIVERHGPSRIPIDRTVQGGWELKTWRKWARHDSQYNRIYMKLKSSFKLLKWVHEYNVRVQLEYRKGICGMMMLIVNVPVTNVWGGLLHPFPNIVNASKFTMKTIRQDKANSLAGNSMTEFTSFWGWSVEVCESRDAQLLVGDGKYLHGMVWIFIAFSISPNTVK